MHEQFEQLQYAQPFNETLSQNKQEHLNLLDDDIQGFSDLVLKIRQQLTPQSVLFRHAIRIAVVFAAGYAISLLPFAQHGYWILLTSLFVCQITYFATKSRLKLRTIGTLLGVLLGIPILYFVPSIEGQLILTIICGVNFSTYARKICSGNTDGNLNGIAHFQLKRCRLQHYFTSPNRHLIRLLYCLACC